MPETTPKISLRIDDRDEDRPVAEVVAAALGSGIDRAMQLIERGGLWIGKLRVRDAAVRTKEGMEITIHRPPFDIYIEVVLDPAWIIYEDADLLALNKPPTLYVDVTPWDIFGNLRTAVERFLAQRDGIAPPLHLVHRLDRDTSGVLLFSKNPHVNAALQKAFVTGDVHKQYLCLCAGEPEADLFEVATGHGRSAYGLFRVYPLEHVGQFLLGGSRVKLMQTRFVVERRMGEATLVQAFPKTGRTHQIRLHLAYLNHPVLGDLRYGGPAVWCGQPLAYHLLHAARLELPHPRTKAALVLDTSTPAWAK